MRELSTSTGFMELSPKVSLEQDELSSLQTILGEDISATWIAKLVAEAGAREALDTAIGKITPMTLAQQRQYRARFILEKVDAEQAEIVVAALFKIPPSSAKRLIETTAARFDIELRDKIEEAARAALVDRRVTWVKKSKAWEIPLSSTVVRKWIREQVSRGGQPHPRISEREAFWLLPDGAYAHICKIVGIDRKPIPK